MSSEDISSTPKQDDDPQRAEKHTVDHLEYVPKDGDDAAPHIHLKTWLVLFSVCSLAFVQLTNVIGSAAFARNVAAVVGGSSKQVWLNTAISISTAVLSPITSQASDLWGRKWFVVVSGVLGFTGCLVTARATSMNMAIGGQIIAGVGFGAQPLVNFIPSEIVHRKYRTYANAGLNIAAGAGAILGLLMGGALTRHDNEGFRTYFEIAAGIYAASAVICTFLYNPPKRAAQVEFTLTQKFKALDWVGELLLGSSLTLILLGFTWAENPYPWRSGHVLGTLITGFCLALTLAGHQIWIKKDGLFNHKMWSLSSTPALCLVAVAIEGLVFFVLSNYFPQETAILYTQDGLLITTRFSIIFISAVFFLPFVGWFGTRFKQQGIIACCSFAGFATFAAAMTTANVSTSTNVWCFTLIAGFAQACGLTSIATAAQLRTPPEMIATITGLIISIRSLGGAIGTGISTAIFNSQLNKVIGPDVAAAVVPLGLLPSDLPAFIGALSSGNIPAALKIPGVTPQMLQAGGAALLSAFAYAFKYIWIFVASVSAVGFAACIFIRDDRSQYNVKIDAPVEKEEELRESHHV